MQLQILRDGLPLSFPQRQILEVTKAVATAEDAGICVEWIDQEIRQNPQVLGPPSTCIEC